MKKFMAINIVLLLASCSFVHAMVLEEGSTTVLTTNPDHSINWGEGYLAVDDGGVIWVDNGAGLKIFSFDLEDLTGTAEIAIDGADYPDIFDFYQLKFSPPYALFLASTNEGQSLMLAHGDENSQVSIQPFEGSDKSSMFDISDNWMVYTGWDPVSESQAIFAADLSDPSVIRTSIAYLYEPDENINNKIVLKNHKIYFNSYTYDYETWTYTYYLKMIDISDPCQPQVFSTALPEETYIDNFDVSDTCLAIQGSFGSFYGLAAISNYMGTDSGDWNIVTLSEDQIATGPVVSGNTVFWVSQGSTQAAAKSSATFMEEPDEYIRIMAASLIPNSDPAISVLYTLTTENASIDDLKVDGSNHLVWKEMNYNDSSLSNIYAAKIKLTCGDLGYARGDIDENCRVDMMDFAILAQDWLKCTHPDGCNF